MGSPSYELQLESRVAAGPDVYTFRSADGVVSKDEFRTAELLLLESVAATNDDVLVVDGNYGVVPTVLSHLSRGATTVTETSARAARLCERNLAANDARASVELVVDVTDLTDRFDAAAYAPKPYDPLVVGKQRAADALARLRPGGTLSLAAAKTEGAGRYRDALEDLAGDVERVARSGGVRVYRAERPPDGRFEHRTYVEPRTLSVTLVGADCEFVTRPGLFSPAAVDRGTELLAETVRERTDLDRSDRLLDVACGYGPLGIALAKSSGCAVWLSDDSRVATACAAESATRTGVDPAGIATADCLAGVEGPFDLAVSNPPTHAGKGVTRELFSATAGVLGPDGECWLVYNETMGYEERLPDLGFESAEVVDRAEGYALTVARR